jgi:pimeloyl-ACP methyl ester carboxylesterase
LKSDHTFDNSDIFVYSYRSDVRATLSIDELTDNMRAALGAYGVLNHSKIIFLSHSMGGIVTRAFLLKYKTIADKTLLHTFSQRRQREVNGPRSRDGRLTALR